METICLQCGNKGYDNAFVFCVKCVAFAVHRYCLDVVPEDFDEFVYWVCDDCEAERQARNVSTLKNFEKDGIITIETKEHVYEDFPRHLYVPCTKFDLIECPEASNESYFEEFRGLNNEENDKTEQNSQQLEQGEDGHNKTRQDKLSDFIPLKANMKRKRSKINKSTMKKGYSNSSKKPFVECENIDRHKPFKLASDDPISCEVKEKKISELGMMENPVLSCNVSSKSAKKKKKTLLSPETNLEEQNQENNGVEFVNRCVGMRMESGLICTSIGHKENGGLEVGKEFPKDTNMLECSTCAEPIITPIWSGTFNMSGKRHDILDGLKGHISSKACQKVYEEMSLFQQDLHLKMLPHSDVWPKRFELSNPNEEDIAVFFFPSKISEPAYDHLIDDMRDKDLALKGVVQNAEILIFTSMVLRLLYWSFVDKESAILEFDVRIHMRRPPINRGSFHSILYPILKAGRFFPVYQIVVDIMAGRYGITKFNGSNFMLWKIKIQAVLRKENCLAAIGDRPVEITDNGKWNEMNDNAVANLHLTIGDEVLLSISEIKPAKRVHKFVSTIHFC